MKVKCIANSCQDIEDPNMRSYLEKNHPTGYASLEVGKKYMVYGLAFIDNTPIYYIRLEQDEVSPYPCSPCFFEIKDRRMSSYWRWFMQPDCNGNLICYLVFPEWGAQAMFYENLIDGDPKAEALFGNYKKLMDEEFL